MFKRLSFASILILCGLGITLGHVFAQKAPTAEGLAAWQKSYEVFSHPRCSNCHVPEDGRPRWSGPSYGDGWRYHGMYVHGGESRIGNENLPCLTCHQETNSPVPHGPPGAHAWALPPASMEWWQKSSGFICNQIKDPTRNGDRSVQDIVDHILKDELVHWGWDPGPGREPAPYSPEELAGFLQIWIDAGAPCPLEQNG